MGEDCRVFKSRPKLDRAVNHRLFLGDNFCSPRHAAQATPGVGSITLDGSSVFFSNNMAILRQNYRKCFPIVRKKCAIF